MVQSIHAGGWTTGFFAAAGTLPDDEPEPMVLLMETSGRIATMIGELCDFMNVRIVAIPDEASLRRNLWIRRPIGVICNLTEIDGSPDCGVLKLVADYDRRLPVLLVSHNHPATVGIIDATEEICRMTHVTRLTTVPAAFEIVEFLFQATRRSGIGRGLPA